MARWVRYKKLLAKLSCFSDTHLWRDYFKTKLPIILIFFCTRLYNTDLSKDIMYDLAMSVEISV